MNFHLILDPAGELIAQIYGQLRAAILDGRLAPGDKLPPSRTLAVQLGVSRKTVTEAYERLGSEGFITSRVGAATLVAHGAARSQAQSPAKPVAAIPLPRWQGIATPLLSLASQPSPPCDFRGGLTDTSLFPFDVWRGHLMHALRRQARHRSQTLSPDGLPELRELIARQLAVSRAVRCTADDLLITQGAQQAIALLAHVLVAPGTVVAVEDPGYPPARTLFQSMGARVVGVPVDGEGLCVDALPDDARLVYVTPSHQFPLGMPMSLPRRQALLDWAAARGAVVVEDDYDSEFRYEGRALDALHSLDRHGLVAYVGTFSKVMFAELRLGYVAMPPALRTALRQAKHLVDWYSAPLEQMALARFIDSGDYARHTRRCHKHYAARRLRLLEALRGPLSPWLHAQAPMAGIHLAAKLASPLQAAPVAGRAREAGIGLYPITSFYLARPAEQGFLIGFGGPGLALLDEGLAKLGAILHDMAPR